MKPETRLQIDIVEWLRFKFPNLLFTSTQAGDRRSALGAIMMKRMGYCNGTPDLLIFRAAKGWNGLMIELKTGTGKVSQSQKDFAQKAENAGYKYIVAYGIDQAKDQIGGYLL
jgi:hypothetical protein